MPLKYQREVQERLKYYIYTGEVDKFKELFNVIKAHDKDRADAYLKGSEDKERGLLSWAAEEVGSKEIMSFLLDEGADINQQDDQGYTPLWYAIGEEFESNVKFLISKEAKTDIPDKEGNTSLHMAAFGESEEVIKILLDAGADFNAKNLVDAMPLHIAARYSLKALHAFIEYRKSDLIKIINTPDNEGNTPLHYAALDESGLNATYLLLLGADRTIKNNEGKLPVHVAYDIETNDKTVHAILEFTKEVKKTITAEDFYESLIADTIDIASSHMDVLGGKGAHDASDEE